MEINSIQLTNQQNLISDYRKNDPNIMQYFDYGMSDKDMKQRLKDVYKYNFNRNELVTALTELNSNWKAPHSTMENIKRLNDSKSVVVIGGQQAGLLTGPMYTVNKIISIIQYARQQEKELDVPVVPVFWVAGEDHDFAEINHIFMPDQNQMKKITTSQYVYEKKPVSDITLDKERTEEWINRVFKELQETEYTKDLLSAIKQCAEMSDSYVDFFARVIFNIFSEEGLVLIDSGHPKIRQLESSCFINLIDNQTLISTGVYGALEDLKRSGYDINLDVDQNNTHLFYHDNHERILLSKTEEDKWTGKNNEVELTTEELKKVAQETPEKLSNNVVTRPLMQEFLFPTLAFIGGPGEVGYWASLKPAFHAIGLKMPPVIPRLSISYLTDHSVKLMKKYSLELDAIINHGLEKHKETWLSAKIDPPIEETVSEIKDVIERAHKPLRDMAQDLRADLGAMAEKNLNYLHHDIDYLEKRITQVIEEQYHQEINEFDYLNTLLHPDHGLQERVWNPLLFINICGKQFIKKLARTSLPFDQEHLVIRL